MWLDIVYEMGKDYYFVCDNKWLEHKILKRRRFYDKDIKFIPSYSYRIMRVADKLCSEYWKFATYAHLTPFYHSRKKDINVSGL